MPQLPVKDRRINKVEPKSPSITLDYSPNHIKLEKPQGTSQVIKGNMYTIGITFTISAGNFHKYFK